MIDKNSAPAINTLYGLVIAAIFVLAASPVFAADLNTTVSRLINGELTNVPDLINAVFYIGGAAYMGTGLLKIKQHADNPGQTKLGEGVSRLGIGAALLVLPFFSSVVINTFGWNGQTGAPYTDFNPVH